ncbi:hypothetical protein DOU06_15695, partial [Clavibacter michiganensis subsp. michiganensis]|nr:hypothetical protein [Clavibacter michiganensis subsp. michiganensis]
ALAASRGASRDAGEAPAYSRRELAEREMLRTAGIDPDERSAPHRGSSSTSAVRRTAARRRRARDRTSLSALEGTTRSSARPRATTSPSRRRAWVAWWCRGPALGVGVPACRHTHQGLGAGHGVHDVHLGEDDVRAGKRG